MAAQPRGLRLGTKFLLAGAALVLLAWTTGSAFWVVAARREIAAKPAQEAGEVRRAVGAAVDASLRIPPEELRTAVLVAEQKAQAVAELRSSNERVRRLTPPADLRELVRERLLATELAAAWIREADGAIAWSFRGAPLETPPGALDGECEVRLDVLPRAFGRCLELTVVVGPVDYFRAGAVRLPGLVAADGRTPEGRWAVLLAGSPPELLESSPDWPELVLSHEFTDSLGPFDVRTRDVALPEGLVRVEAARAEGRPIVIAAVVPAPRPLAALDLLRGDAGPLTTEWQLWLAWTGGAALLVIALLATWALRLNRAFAPLVAAADRISRGDLDFAVESRRRDEVGTLARWLTEAAVSLKQARSAYEAAARAAAWRDVARGIAHEIKNPLMPIRGAVESLLRWRREDPPRFESLFEPRMGTVLEEVETLRRLASSFSEFAQLPAPVKSLGDLNAIVRDVAALHATAPGIVVEDRLDPGLPPTPFDAGQLRQVVANLVKNAVEAMGTGGGALVIETGDDGRRSWAAVADTGPGATDEALAALFTPYFSTKGESGTGLGLFLSRRMVVEHGGSLDAERRPGGGLRLVLTLPRD